jgi:transposase-like protein
LARTRTITVSKHKAERIDLKALVSNDREFLRQLIRTTLQEVLEAEMTEALAAAKSERTVGRNGYRSGYYGRSLITRVGKLELRIPQDRTGRFSTELRALFRYDIPIKRLSHFNKNSRPGCAQVEDTGGG